MMHVKPSLAHLIHADMLAWLLLTWASESAHCHFLASAAATTGLSTQVNLSWSIHTPSFASSAFCFCFSLLPHFLLFPAFFCLFYLWTLAFSLLCFMLDFLSLSFLFIMCCAHSSSLLLGLCIAHQICVIQIHCQFLIRNLCPVNNFHGWGTCSHA
ncbi:hypothetical protein ID866_11175 [Astraeus odoratus]|nr:hypothetical protein ID866_11175 [Astraeus odoratus]